jgi:hypothetical protein
MPAKKQDNKTHILFLVVIIGISFFMLKQSGFNLPFFATIEPLGDYKVFDDFTTNPCAQFIVPVDPNSGQWDVNAFLGGKTMQQYMTSKGLTNKCAILLGDIAGSCGTSGSQYTRNTASASISDGALALSTSRYLPSPARLYILGDFTNADLSVYYSIVEIAQRPCGSQSYYFEPETISTSFGGSDSVTGPPELAPAGSGSVSKSGSIKIIHSTPTTWYVNVNNRQFQAVTGNSEFYLDISGSGSISIDEIRYKKQQQVDAPQSFSLANGQSKTWTTPTFSIPSTNFKLTLSISGQAGADQLSKELDFNFVRSP